jgi:hypothetical protein
MKDSSQRAFSQNWRCGWPIVALYSRLLALSRRATVAGLAPALSRLVLRKLRQSQAKKRIG